MSGIRWPIAHWAPSDSVQTPQHLIRQLYRLWHHISRRRRGQFGLLLVLMVLASLAEIVSIGAVLPFLGVLTSPERVFGHQLSQPYIQIFGLSDPKQLLLPLSLSMLQADPLLSQTTGY